MIIYLYWPFDMSITLFSWLVLLAKSLKKKPSWRLLATKVHEGRHSKDQRTPLLIIGWFKFMLRWLFDALWKAWYEVCAYAESYPIWRENGYDHDFLVKRAAQKIVNNKYPKWLRWICKPPSQELVEGMMEARLKELR